MSKKEVSLSIGKLGMNKEGHLSSLNKEEYSHAKNSNLFNEYGNGLNLQSEHSNILTTRFKEGKIGQTTTRDWKVVGFRTHVNKDRTYYFITNIKTGVSEIGYISNIVDIKNEEDLQVNCGDCDVKNNLATPLEDTVQEPTHQYVTLLEDSCNKCLNFSIDYPIHYIEIKEEVTGTVLYWTDFNNPQRYLNVDEIDSYKVLGREVCGEDQTEPICVDCTKMRMNPFYNQMGLEADVLQTGGNLRKGSYEFLVAYCNEEGLEMTEYHSITQPIYIFDMEDRVMSEKDISERTNFAIKLKVLAADTTFHFYKVAVIQRTDTGQTESYFIEGIHPVTDTSIVYTSEANKLRTDRTHIFQVKPVYRKAEKVVASGDMLFQMGVEHEVQWNLQPVVNFMGTFAKWITVEASEDLYKNGVQASKYKTRMRDEVYPHGIRFLTNTGYYSPVYPLISRPPNTYDLEVVDNLDTQSVIKNSLDCIDTDREKRWQFYNTATNDGVLSTYEPSDETVMVPMSKYCITEDIEQTGPGTITLPISDFEDFVYVDLADFIRNNYEYIINYDCNPPDDTGICELKAYLTATYPPCDASNLFPTCETGDDGCSINCEEPILVEGSTELRITEVGNETAEYIEKDYVDEEDNDYSRSEPPEACYYYIYNDEGKPTKDEEASGYYNMYWVASMYLRESTLQKEKCSGADEIINKTEPSMMGQPYYMNYYGTHMEDITGLPDLLQDKNIPIEGQGTFQVTFGGFTPTYSFHDKLHKGALWLKGDSQGKNRFLLEVTEGSMKDCRGDDFLAFAQHYRISIWKNCSSQTAIWSSIRRVEDGLLLLIDLTEPQWEQISNGSFYVTIDSPIMPQSSNTKYLITPPCKCVTVFTRPIEYKEVEVTYDYINFDLQQKYTASCRYFVPQPNDCNPQSYQTGQFGYWESLEEYPDNSELFNSNVLDITPEDIPESIRADFETKYVANVGEKYRLKEGDFRCKPIRHFKYPDSNTSPFITNIATTPFSSSVIYPIGITIDENIINSFLNVAVKNKLITQEQRDSIVGYELLVGDRLGNKSIQAKGVVYDSMSYKEDNKTIEYSNFPFNDLGDNKLFKTGKEGGVLTHPHGGAENNKFMFMSPDLYSSTSINPTEISVEGYMFGNSRHVIKEVEDHPEWVILGRRAKRTASQFAALEVTSEIFMEAMRAMEVFRIDAGVVVSLNVAGIVLYVINLAFAIANAFIRAGRYRLEWLRTIRDLGTPVNFAARNTGVGIYGYLGATPLEDNKLRGVSGIKKLKSGRQTVTDRQGNISYINNVDREASLFLTTGKDFKIEYPNEYINHDNNKTNYSSSSRFIASEEQCETGVTNEFIKNVASPYFSLKNYMPNQYGTVDSIKWLTTSYKGVLGNPQDNPRIFGGDTYISRFAEIRKIPLFLVTAMGQADLTPYEYKKYSNLGEHPTYYCDYESGGGTTLGSVLFPDFDSDFKMDCVRDTGGFYIKSPSKFYLYYHGIASYMVESEINCNFRYTKEGLENSFYPEEEDYIKITEQSKRPIREPNRFFYNTAYSKQVSTIQHSILPSTYDRELYSKIAKGENNVIYSEKDSSEYSKTDPWLIYKPNNYFHFSTSNGKLMDLKAIESEQMLARFENMYAIFNALDNIDRITPELEASGTGGVFSRRPLEFNRTELGYAGTQHKAIVSCEYGHFWADAERGQVFCLQPGAKLPQEISKAYNDQPTNMRSWFKEHLPFNIKKIGGADMDNSFKGVGLTMGWDSRYQRVFLTKRDYKPLVGNICYSEGHFYDTSPEVVDPIISTNEADGWDFKGIEDCKLKFTKEGNTVSAKTNIYAFIDCTSTLIQDAILLKSVLQNWFQEYQTNNPTYLGNLYIVPVGTNTTGTLYERYLLYPVSLRTGQAELATDPQYLSLAELPPNFNTPNWVPEEDGVIIAFVDEVRSQNTDYGYHDVIVNSFDGQITTAYKDDYLGFKNIHEDFEYFKAVLYPIPRLNTSTTQALVLQGMAAIEGKILNATELAAFDPQVDVTKILTENPYMGAIMPDSSVYVPLKELGWRGVYNKVSPASSVFSSETFGQELTDIIQEGGVGESLEKLVDLPEIYLDDPTKFKDVSWTMAFSPIMGKWISFYDFKPNYYVSQKNYFQTGINYSTNGDEGEFGLWSHLLTNRSYQVFYGKAYDWEIEIPTENKGSKKVLETASYIMESLRYHNDYDFSENNNLGFDEMIIWNNTNNSGKLNLIRQTSISQINKYPKTNGNKSQDVLQVNDEGVWSINYFYNRVKNQNNNVPLWLSDENQIEKELNQQAVSFYGKKVLERMRGQSFLINLKSKDTQHKKIFKISYLKENNYF